MPLEIVMEAGRLFPLGPYYESRFLPQAPWHMARRFNIIEKQPSFTKFHGQSGASRLEDIEFLFGTLIQDGIGTFEETTLSSSMMQMLSTFIRNGSLPRVDGDEWPLYEGETRKRVSIRSDGLRILPGDTVDKCYRLYESFMPELMFNAPI
ncbi:uncharacterized protein LOC142803377 [Rhipicephalus microplus]|uniref:uncharacterized protein LOC142803377 n=1 Tax=Rhipicephalus microplus TaxID=6941 RepID=UPI003F6D65FC